MIDSGLKIYVLQKENLMQTAKLEFQIKRGIVNCDDLDDEIKGLVSECLLLCLQKDYKSAVDLIMPIMAFEWYWGNCDGDPSDVFENPEDVAFDLNTNNCSVKVGEESGSLILTASVFFDLQVKDGSSLEEITEWLSDNSAYSCGYVGGGWIYVESDGDNVYVNSLN